MTDFEKYLLPPEQATASRTIEVLLDSGYWISVYDGVEVVLRLSLDPGAIKAAMGSTEEDYLFVYPSPNGPRDGWVRFIWGNEDWVALADHTTNLQDVLQPVQDWLEEQESK